MADRAVRLRACVGLALAGVLVLVGPFAGAASAAPSRRVVVVWVGGTSLDDWMRFGGPALRAVLAEGAVGVVHTGPATTGSGFANGTLDGTALAAHEAGANTGPGSADALRPGAEREGVGQAYARAGMSVGFVGSPVNFPIDTFFPAGVALMFGRGSRLASGSGRSYLVTDPSVPGGLRTDSGALAEGVLALVPTAGFVAVDTQDPVRFDALVGDPLARERWIARALASSDTVIAAARASVGPDGTMIVLSAPGPRARETRGEHLGAVAIVGAAFPPGLLTSATSRVPGLVSLIDVTPTTLRAAGLPSSPSLRGSGMTVQLGAGGTARARRLDRALATAARARPRVLAILFGALACASLLTALLFVARRGRAPRGRVPRGLRDVPLLLFSGCALAPAALVFGNDWRALAVAAAGALLVRIAVGARWCVPVASVIGGLSPAVVTLVAPARAAALALGSARASVLPPGTDPAIVGLALCATLIALGTLSDHRAIRPWLRAGAALALGAGAALLAGDARMIAVAALASVWFIAREGGRSFVRVSTGVGALATISAAMVVLSGPEPFAYVAEARALISAHLSRASLEAFTVLAGLPLLIAMLGRPAEAARASFGSPGVRAGIGASVVAACATAVAYPGGASTTAWVLVPAVAAAGAILIGSRSAAPR